MADQDRCPDCGGTGAVEVRFPISEGYPECPVCGGTGQDGPQLMGGRKSTPEKLRDPAGDTSSLAPEFSTHGRAGVSRPTKASDEEGARRGNITSDRQDGEGPGQPGSSPNLPADLIDRAVEEAIEPLRKRGIIPGKKHLRTAVEIVAPLLMEARAKQENARWVTRIEREVELFDARAALSEQGMEEPLPSSDVARLLRYLLDEEREATNAGSLIERGRQQERERIKSLLEARTREAADDYRRDPQAYHRGREDELVMVADELTTLDKEDRS